MTRWNLTVPTETDRLVRTFLAQRGMKKGDLSHFVNDAVRKAVFDETVRSVKARNADADPDAIKADILKSIEEARADRS